MIRIGHMGWVEEPELAAALDAVDSALAARGWKPAGVAEPTLVGAE
jgi:aspartate aminotransferase-like enzyme